MLRLLIELKQKCTFVEVAKVVCLRHSPLYFCVSAEYLTQLRLNYNDAPSLSALTYLFVEFSYGSSIFTQSVA